MQLTSNWTFDCAPEHIWPNFLHARMDDTRPLLFRLGIPKPISCKVLEGVPALNHTRQCTTDQGTIDQRILTFDEERCLRYRMIDATIPKRHWIGHLEDRFSLLPLPDGRTRVERRTVFTGRGLLAPLKTLALLVALTQAHRYAARNWRRLALARKAAGNG